MTRTVGIVLIVIGALMMVYTGFTYVTTKRVVDLGPIKVDKEKSHPVQWSPIIGGVLLLAGVVVVAGNKKT